MSLTPEDKQWILEQLEKVKTTTLGQLEKIETRLLAAFHDWSELAAVRMRSHADDIRALQVDLEILQDRVAKLEDRKQ